jgi:hypothetical protein
MRGAQQQQHRVFKQASHRAMEVHGIYAIKEEARTWCFTGNKGLYRCFSQHNLNRTETQAVIQAERGEYIARLRRQSRVASLNHVINSLG